VVSLSNQGRGEGALGLSCYRLLVTGDDFLATRGANACNDGLRVLYRNAVYNCSALLGAAGDTREVEALYRNAVTSLSPAAVLIFKGVNGVKKFSRECCF
jgi:hypothetical protein